MATYIALLRGINVLGKKIIKMTELARLFESLGFTGVKTYIQSGNVIFSVNGEIPGESLTNLIRDAILKKFGFMVNIIIVTPEDLIRVKSANPFKNNDGTAKENIYITFLERKPDPANISTINPSDYLPDRFIIINNAIYLDCAGGYGTTKLSNTFFENRLKVHATTRNWRTVNQLIELALNEKP
jgi:uncharacterized protein (DUF1697 family)